MRDRARRLSLVAFSHSEFHVEIIERVKECPDESEKHLKLLVASSLLVVRSGAPSSFLFLVVRPLAHLEDEYVLYQFAHHLQNSFEYMVLNRLLN